MDRACENCKEMFDDMGESFRKVCTKCYAQGIRPKTEEKKPTSSFKRSAQPSENIVRMNALTNAVNFLVNGKKDDSEIRINEVITTAQAFEKFVKGEL